MNTAAKKAIFLDRDGTINEDREYVYRSDDWRWADEAVPEAMRRLQRKGYKLIVVTNQSGIGHGLYSLDDMKKLHQFMRQELAKEGVKIDLIVYCSHARDSGCRCRKPATGMIEEAIKKIGGINLSDSWTIGDKMIDMEMGHKAGTKTALLRSKYWTEAELKARDRQPDITADTLLAVTNEIIKQDEN